MSSAIKIKKLSKVYPNNVEALKGIDLDIQKAESGTIVSGENISENKTNENISKETTSDKLKDNKDKKE